VGIKTESILKTLKSFETLPHRLQNIGKYNGVTYFDDSISTIPQATLAAIKSL
jgi:UDP-N-acetylmuramoylalanine--D-glutamate ligase